MLVLWEYITLFVSSFSITSFCVYNNCLNYHENEKKFDENVINILQDSYSDDSYKLYRIDENDYY